MLPILVIEHNNRVMAINNYLCLYTLLLPYKKDIMATPSSPKVIQQQIDAATQNQQSLVQWLGTGGLQSVLTGMNQNTVYRGIMNFPDTTSMSLAGGTDSEFAVCPNSDGALTLYKYYPNIDITAVGGVTSSVGGQWRPIFAQTIENVARWTSITVSFTPTIGQTSYVVNLVTPITTFYNVLVTPIDGEAGLLLAGEAPTGGYFVENKTTTSFTLFFNTPAISAALVNIEIAIIY